MSSTIKKVAISTANSSDTNAANKIVAGVANAQIRVLKFFIVAAGAVTATFESFGTGATALTGAMSMVAGVPLADSGFYGGPSRGTVSLFDCKTGEDLRINLGGAVQVSGYAIVEITPIGS